MGGKVLNLVQCRTTELFKMWSTQDVSETKTMLDKNKKTGYWIVAVVVIFCFATGKLIATKLHSID